MGLPFKSRGEASAASLTPGQIANLAAWYDVSSEAGTTSNLLRIDASNRVSLIADRSGNSGVNCLCSTRAAGNNAILTTGSSIGTGAFTASATFRVPLAAETSGIIGFTDSTTTNRPRAMFCELRATGHIYFTLTGATAADGRTLEVANFFTGRTGQVVTVTFTRTGGTFAAYVTQNGVTAQLTGSETTIGTPPAWSDTITSTNTIFASNASAGSENLTGPYYRASLYSAVLDAAGILADAAGQVQANNVVFVNFALAGKLANSFTATSGQTVTINSSGDLGARICGERDLVQLTASKQPIYLPWSGTNYGWQPGSVSYFSTPDAAPVDITGDIDLRFFGAATDWTPSVIQHLVSKYGAAGQRGYVLSINTTGRPRVITSSDGTATITSDATAAVPFADREAGWVRATVDVDNGAGGNTVTFFTSADGVNWTQLGSPVVNAGTTSIFNNSTAVNVGDLNNGSSSFSGSIFRAQVLNGINGTVVADFDPSRYTSGTTFTASTGEVWTLNGGATIVTATSLYFDGTDDYMKAAAFSLSQPETVYFVGQQVSWTASDSLYDGFASTSMRVYGLTSSPNLVLDAGGGAPQNNGFAVGSRGLLTAVVNGASSALRVNRVAAATGNAGAANAGGFTLGSRGAADSVFANMATNEVAIYAAAHDTATVDRFALYAASKWRISGV